MDAVAEHARLYPGKPSRYLMLRISAVMNGCQAEDAVQVLQVQNPPS
jgi:hypothetical protein